MVDLLPAEQLADFGHALLVRGDSAGANLILHRRPGPGMAVVETDRLQLHLPRGFRRNIEEAVLPRPARSRAAADALGRFRVGLRRRGTRLEGC